MSKSNIEWTESTWNPIVGCSIVSPGCTNCYAMKTASRNEAMGISRYDGTTRVVNGNTVWTGKLAQAPESTLLQPLKRKKPTTYFVNSVPRGLPRCMGRSRLRGDGVDAAAYLSGADEAGAADAGLFPQACRARGVDRLRPRRSHRAT